MVQDERVGPMLMTRGTDGRLNPLVAQLTHLPFPEVAATLRSVAERITVAWDAAVREAMPQMRHLSFDELKDSTPQILAAIADALASDDPDVIRELVECAPSQGLSRFYLNFDVVEVMQEDRLLRAITVQHVEDHLGRRLCTTESAALHAMIDLMLQRSVIALVTEQKTQLRAAAETELKFVSFLSHDLNNNLNNVNLLLSVHAGDLAAAGGFPDAVESLALAQRSIEDTVTGMRRMLDHERLRNAGEPLPAARVDLHEVASLVGLQFGPAAREKGVRIAVDVGAGTAVESSGELITLVLQNLVGNAVKYSGGGTVRVGSDGRAVWVSDEGPGIAPAMVKRIFEAFRRGEVHGQSGVGLGLAIASQGARLLGARLTVASELGVGSTFRLALPTDPAGGSAGAVA